MRSSQAAYASLPTGGGDPFAKLPRFLSEELMHYSRSVDATLRFKGIDSTGTVSRARSRLRIMRAESHRFFRYVAAIRTGSGPI
jgi:hypothetical protein